MITAQVLLALTLALPAAAGDPVSLVIPPPAGGKVYLAEVFEIKVEASLPENYSLAPDTASASTPEFQILSFDKSVAPGGGGRKTETFTIKAKPFALGVSTFPALAWNLSVDGRPDPTVVRSGSFTLDIQPLFKDTEKSDIRDIRPPYPYTPWLLIAALLLLLGAGAVYLYRRLGAGPKGGLFSAGPWQDSRSPYQRARDRLDKLRSSPLAEKGRFKEYYTGLTSILRLYLAEEFGLAAELMTTSDLARALKNTGAEIKTVLKARDLLGKADLVKFARMMPEDAGADAESLAALLTEFNVLVEKTRALEAAAKAAAELAAKNRRGGWRP